MAWDDPFSYSLEGVLVILVGYIFFKIFKNRIIGDKDDDIISKEIKPKINFFHKLLILFGLARVKPIVDKEDEYEDVKIIVDKTTGCLPKGFTYTERVKRSKTKELENKLNLLEEKLKKLKEKANAESS